MSKHDTAPAASRRGYVPFQDRLRETMGRLDLPDVQIKIYESRPGSSWEYDAVVVSPGFRGMPRSERNRLVHGLVLDHLWDEQGRVGGLFTYTPEEVGARTAGGEPATADAGDL